MTGVLVTGGTGKTGGALAELLRRREVAFRVGTRNPAPGQPDAVRFDWDDDTTHGAALEGVDRVYLVPPPAAVDPMPVVGPFLARAERSGVRRVVLLSSSIEFPNAPGRIALQDQIRQRSGWVVLRPSGFMQNFLRPHPTARGIRRRGEIRTSAGAGRVGWIDTRDVAEAAGALLSDPEHDVEDDYVLTGPEALNYHDAAGVIAAEVDRPVRVAEVDVDQMVTYLRASGIPDPFADSLARAEISVRRGDDERITTSVRDLTGRSPRTFADFVHEHAGEWVATSGNGAPPESRTPTP